jgi:hypothetical protein
MVIERFFKKYIVLCFACIFYLTMFVFFYKYFGPRPGLGYFFLIPLICVALLFGFKGGILAGVISHPFNVMLYFLLGSPVGLNNFRAISLIAWGFAIIIGGCIGYMRNINIRHKDAIKTLEKINQKLMQARAELKIMSGLLPICSHCKKIRDDKGYWNQIEVYIDKHSEANFSHSICPDCAKTHYPDIKIY